MAPLIAAAAGLIAAASPAGTDVPNPRHIAADTSFIAHIDFDQVTRSSLGEAALRMLYKPDSGQGLAEVTTDLGIEFGEDIHAVTIYGGEGDPVILLYGSEKLDRWDEALEAEQKGERRDRIRRHEVRDIDLGDGGVGAMLEHGAGRLWVLAGGLAQLEHAIEVVEGDAETVDLDAWPVAGPARGTMVYVGVRDLEALSAWQPASEIARRAAGFSVSIGELRDNAFVHAQIVANDADEALAIVEVANGLRGLGKLVALNEPDLKPMMNLIGDISISAEGAHISATFEHDAESLRDLLSGAID